MTVLTEHDLNASYALLESLTCYWMLFAVVETNASYIRQYFDQMLAVVSSCSSLLYPVYVWLGVISSPSGITNSFALN